MFRRLIFENWISIFTLVAFITSASVYVSFAWSACRMNQRQVQRLASMPLESSGEDDLSHD
jgi:hypothetical protein